MKNHWNSVYTSREVCNLGWYEESPTPSLTLISKTNINKEETILDVGAGATTLIDNLLEQGYKNIVAVDISEVALNRLQERLGEEKKSLVKWIVDDITQPIYVDKLKNIALWHDRAVLHFLLEEKQQQMYLQSLKKIVRPGGNAIIAAFSLKGAKKCSGLNIKNYDQNMLANFLGEEFDLIEYFDYTYKMPSGDLRPYIYTFFKRT
jgi:ubiquinone/menaquinone biosynthesis C-methylase UbiE